MNPTNIYNIAKSCLGKHITLDQEVPAEVGCAEAISYILWKAGFTIPSSGIASTADLYTFLNANFDRTETPVSGSIVISPTGQSSIGSPHGHVGIVGEFGILSNDSQSGLFLELWTVPKWIQYYNQTLGFPVYYFNPK